MTKISTILLALALGASAAFCADPPTAEAKPSAADQLYEKALKDSRAYKETEKAYEAYAKSLDKANKEIISALESAKKDLEKTPYNGGLSVQERAKALEELDQKIDDVKKGAIGDSLVAKKGQEGDLLGKGDLAKMIVGKWLWNGKVFEFGKNGKIVDGWGGVWKIVGNKILVIVPDGREHILTMDDDNNSLGGVRTIDNETFRVTRIK